MTGLATEHAELFLDVSLALFFSQFAILGGGGGGLRHGHSRWSLMLVVGWSSWSSTRVVVVTSLTKVVVVGHVAMVDVGGGGHVVDAGGGVVVVSRCRPRRPPPCCPHPPCDAGVVVVGLPPLSCPLSCLCPSSLLSPSSLSRHCAVPLVVVPLVVIVVVSMQAGWWGHRPSSCRCRRAPHCRCCRPRPPPRCLIVVPLVSLWWWWCVVEGVTVVVARGQGVTVVVVKRVTVVTVVGCCGWPLSVVH